MNVHVFAGEKEEWVLLLAQGGEATSPFMVFPQQPWWLLSSSAATTARVFLQATGDHSITCRMAGTVWPCPFSLFSASPDISAILIFPVAWLGYNQNGPFKQWPKSPGKPVICPAFFFTMRENHGLRVSFRGWTVPGWGIGRCGQKNSFCYVFLCSYFFFFFNLLLQLFIWTELIQICFHPKIVV